MATTYQKVELINPLIEDQVLHPATVAEVVKFADGTTLDRCIVTGKQIGRAHV